MTPNPRRLTDLILTLKLRMTWKFVLLSHFFMQNIPKTDFRSSGFQKQVVCFQISQEIILLCEWLLLGNHHKDTINWYQLNVSRPNSIQRITLLVVFMSKLMRQKARNYKNETRGTLQPTKVCPNLPILHCSTSLWPPPPLPAPHPPLKHIW